MESREVVRSPLRLSGKGRRPLDERLLLRVPALFRLGASATIRLRPRSRLRRALLRRAMLLIVDGQNRGDFELTYVLYAADNELRNIPTGGGAGSVLGLEEVYHGPDGVRRFFEEWAEPWEGWHWEETGDVVDLGGGRALALLRVVGRGRGSGVEVREQVALLGEMKRGRVVRQTNWLGSDAWNEALRSAGLS